MPKKENIEALFDNIAPSYDKLNHILSLNIDKIWRRRAVRELLDGYAGRRDQSPDTVANVPQSGTCRVLDVACGTGDFAIAIAKKCGEGGKITGVDISENMLAIGRGKVAKAGFAEDGGADTIGGEQRCDGIAEDGGTDTIGREQRCDGIAEDGGADTTGGEQRCDGIAEDGGATVKKPRTTIDLQYGDCENLPFADGSFDRVSAAFGVRNFEHLSVGLKEMHRALTTGGKAVILELSIPQNKFVAKTYRLYFEHILPWIGKILSGDKPAYKYLPASVLNFPAPEKFCGMLREAGFTDVTHKAFNLGICRMYVGYRR